MNYRESWGQCWERYGEEAGKLRKEPSRSIDEFAQRAQILNYISHRGLYEAWNHKMWDNTTGYCNPDMH